MTKRAPILISLCITLCLLLVFSVELPAHDNSDATIETRVGQGQLFYILSVASIQKDLALTDEQIAAIAKINQNPIATTFADALRPLTEILTDKQLKEFKRIAFQGLMVRAFTVAEVQDSLELTSDQKKLIAGIQSNLKSKLQPFQDKIKTGKDVDPIAIDRDTKAFHEEAYVEALGLLTTQQRKKWEEIARPVPLRNKKGG